MLWFGLVATGCSWDNDSDYTPHVQAGFMLVSPSTGGQPTIMRVEGQTLQPDWNGDFGYGTLNFSDFAGKEETIWLSSGPRHEIKEINLRRKKVEKTFDTGELSPHFIAIGEKYVIFADSATHQLGFLNTKKREIISVPTDGKPGRIIYNSEKIYVQLDSSRIALYSEPALATLATFEISKPIVEFRFNKQFQVEVTAGTPGDYYLSTIEANGNYLARINTSVNWKKRISSPYFDQRFETEFLNNVEVKNDGRLLAIDVTTQTADNAEVNFFESKMYFSRNDSLFYYDMANDSLIGSQPFPWTMINSWFWIGAD